MAGAPRSQPLVPRISDAEARELLETQRAAEMEVFGKRGIVIATAMKAGFSRRECHRMLGLFD